MKRLLVIAPTFFPNPAVSSIRATELCRHLPAFGWEPVVVTRSYGFRDERLPGVNTHFLDGPAATGPRGGLREKARRWLIGSRSINSLAVPDLSARFWRAALDRIEAIARAEEVDALFTTAPPHSLHLVGLHLRARLGLPWIADFRDPYTIDARFRPTGLGLLRRGAHRSFEAAVHREASRIVHALPAHQRWARRAYPASADKQVLLRNGFPERLAPRPEGRTPSGRIAVIGSSGAAEVLELAEAIARLRRERGLDLQLRHCGAPLGNEAAITALLGEAAVLRGRVPHDEALEEMRQADVLVACHPWARERSHAITSRLYEYLAVGVPVIAINPIRGDRPFLRRFPQVRRLYRPGAEAIAASLVESLSSPVDPGELARFRAAFGREAQARRLAAELDAITPAGSICEIPGPGQALSAR